MGCTVGENAISRGNECSSIHRSAIVFSSFSFELCDCRRLFVCADSAERHHLFLGCLSKQACESILKAWTLDSRDQMTLQKKKKKKKKKKRKKKKKKKKKK